MSVQKETIDQSSIHHFDYLDGWRGLAVLLLLIGHFVPIPGIDLGIVGVNLFFVLSGLLMSSLLFEKQEDLGRFYRRRISRILPAHFVFLALVTALHAVVGLPLSFREIWSAALFVNNYVLPEGGPGTAVMPFGHIWSLSVEEHSYVILSLVAICARAKLVRNSIATGLIMLSVVAFALYYQWINPPQLAFLQWLQTQVAGYGLFAVAMWVASGRPFPRTIARPWLSPFALLLGTCLHWWSVPLAAQKLLGVGLLAVSICALTVSEGWFSKVLCWRPLRLLGLWSFSMYLWQQPFYLMARKDQGFPLWMALMAAITCGLLSFYLVERPARRYLNLHWGSRRDSA